jgi:adenylate cyclase
MTQEGFKRKLTAILSADAVGYSRLMGDDEEATVRTLTSYREVLATLIQQHNGRVLDSPGDNLLAEFVSVVDAVQCAVAVQKEIKARNDEIPETRRMQFRIGINLGDVIQEEERIYGDGVNIAARLEGLAEPGGICVSRTVFDQIESKLPYGYDFIGDQTVKNIARPVGAYRILMDPRVTVSGKPPDKKPAAIRRTPILLGAVAVLVLAVAAGIWQFYVRPMVKPASTEETAFPLPGKRSIAVLPFVNMSGDPDQEYFSDGMTEEIITKLSMNRGIAVIARNSTFFYKGKRVKIRQIAQELGARYVVEGSVRKAGNMVRITAQLIDAATESHLWAKTYDSEFKDIFSLQDEIAQQIVAALNIKSREAEQARAWRVPTENLTAYDSLLRGLSHFFRLTVEENAKAEAMFERAIELDSGYARAYVCLGYAHLMDYAFGSNRDPRTLEQVSEFARKAISLDDSSSLAHVLLADVYRTKGQFEQAISQAERALSLNPNDPSAYLSMGNILNAVGRSEEAVEAIKKAMNLDPHRAVYYNTDLARAYQNLGRYKEAIASLKAALARNPNWPPAYFDLAMNYCMAWGITQDQEPLMLDRALEIAKKLVAIDDSSLSGHFALSLINLYKKQFEKALVEAENLIALAPENADSYALLAVIRNSVGRPGEAIAMVEKAMELNPAVPPWYLSTLATAYSLSGRKSEAVATYKRVFDLNPSHADAFQAHLNLAILYVDLGQEKDARAEAGEILKLAPHFSVEVWGQRIPHKDQAQIGQSMAALRKAGLN